MKAVPNLLLLATLGLAACGGGDTDAPGREVGDPSARADHSAALAPDLDLRTIAMSVPSMSCALCVRSIRARLEEAGLADIHIDLDTKLVRARYDPARITPAEVVALVEGQGFPVREMRLVEPGERAEEGGT